MGKIHLPDYTDWPETVPRFHIVSRKRAASLLMSKSQSCQITHLISIASPVESRAAVWSNVKPPCGLSKIPLRIRVLFDDIEIEHSSLSKERDYYPPTRDHVGRIIRFLSTISVDEPLRGIPGVMDTLTLIHCQAGQSRSAAVGYALALMHLGNTRRAHELAASVCPAGYTPNELLVTWFDDILKVK